MTRYIAVPKEIMVVITDMKSNEKPTASFHGRVLRKSPYSKGDERIERNVTTDVKENARAITSVKVKSLKATVLHSFSRSPGRWYAAE